MLQDVQKLIERQRELSTAQELRQLTDNEDVEYKKLTRTIGLKKLQVAMYGALVLTCFAAFAILTTLNFAQFFAVPGSARDHVLSGAAYETLNATHALCAGPMKRPALYITQTADASFYSAASGKDLTGLVPAKIALTKPFLDHLSRDALLGIFAHEFGYLSGVDGGVNADIFAVKCVGKQAVLRAYDDTEKVFADPQFLNILRKSGSSEGEIADIVQSSQKEIAYRRSIVNGIAK